MQIYQDIATEYTVQIHKVLPYRCGQVEIGEFDHLLYIVIDHITFAMTVEIVFQNRRRNTPWPND